MASRPLPAAAVFDLDGTIVDTEQASFDAWRRTWADHGHELRLEDWVLCVGTDWELFDPMTTLGSLVGAGFDADAVRTARRALEAELVAATVIRAGIEAWLDEAESAAIPLGLASSSPRDWVDAQLDRLGLAARFTTVQSRTEVGVTKPDPASYLAACAALEVDPADALAVEDSANGVAAAKAAGMPTVAFPNPITAGLDLSAADLVLEDLAGSTLVGTWAAVTASRAG